MPPEEAEGLVYLDGVFRDGVLHVRPIRIDKIRHDPKPPPLEILWYERPGKNNRGQYWAVGDDVFFVRRNDAYHDPEEMDEIDMPVRGKNYWWQDYAEAIVLVLPPGHTIAAEQSMPQAKSAAGRIAVLWAPGPASFQTSRLKGGLDREIRRINARYGPEATSNRYRERAYLGEGRPTRAFWPSFLEFWSTLPGILTGVAGLIGAIVLLATTLVATGVCSGSHGALPGGQPSLHMDPAPVLDFGTHGATEFPITRTETVSNYGQGFLRVDTAPRVEGSGFVLSNSSTCYFSVQQLSHGETCAVNIVFTPPSGPNQYIGRLTITDSFDGLHQSVDLRVISR